MFATCRVCPWTLTLAAGMNPMDLKRGIDLAVEAVVEDLKTNSKKATSNEETAGRIGCLAIQTIHSEEIAPSDRHYIDALAAVRNRVVHGSDASVAAYKAVLRSVYGIASAPAPDEFFNATDYRSTSPDRYTSRLNGLATVVKRAIQST